mmetsp:Transcript_6339/g.25684  ORF Transcript_6339/g.25684 Transcript_6339/m.25684 type:complete len:211 (-) Transcript_6339:1026-1658(-)
MYASRSRCIRTSNRKSASSPYSTIPSSSASTAATMALISLGLSCNSPEPSDRSTAVTSFWSRTPSPFASAASNAVLMYVLIASGSSVALSMSFRAPDAALILETASTRSACFDRSTMLYTMFAATDAKGWYSTIRSPVSSFSRTSASAITVLICRRDKPSISSESRFKTSRTSSNGKSPDRTPSPSASFSASLRSNSWRSKCVSESASSM